MRVYALRRLLRVSLMLLAISIVAFMIVELAPVSPILDLRISRPSSFDAAVWKAHIQHRLGTDQPIWLHYLRWLGIAKREDGRVSGILEGDVGKSMWSVETDQ